MAKTGAQHRKFSRPPLLMPANPLARGVVGSPQISIIRNSAPEQILLSACISSAVKLVGYAPGLVSAEVSRDGQILDMVLQSRPELETFRQDSLVILEQRHPICSGLAKNPHLTISSSSAEQARPLNNDARTNPQINPAKPQFSTPGFRHIIRGFFHRVDDLINLDCR
jgi:hypothetical protein